MLTNAEFDNAIAEAMDEIPDEFLQKLDNMIVTAENVPSKDLLQELGIDSRHTLLGVYQGVPFGKKSTFALQPLPNRIVIFRKPILEMCKTREQVVDRIRRVVVHEIAHHFGFSDERLRELGY